MTRRTQTTRGTIGGLLFTTALLMMPTGASAQTATITGNLGGFDVVNDTGQDAHGFEIQIEGATRADLYYTGYGQRYGQGVVTEYATGVYVRWISPYDSDNHRFTATTPQYQSGTPISWNDCYSAGSRYASSGCEHFGQSLRVTPVKFTITYRWLVENADQPGTVKALDRPAAIVAPAPTVAPPPVVVAAPPVVVVEVEAPEPPETPEKYGDAQWMKVYKVQLNHEVSLDDLVSTNTAVVPQDPTLLEVDWQLLQVSPPSNGNGNQKRNRGTNQGAIAPDTRAIVRRYELYKYAGTYDAVTHEALCADLNLCNAPSTGELGDFISAQNSAVNIVPDVLVLTKPNTGRVQSSDKRIDCGNACAAFATAGSSVTLVASPGGDAFAGWTGACTGSLLSCTATVNGITNVGASFLPQFTLSIGRSNSGTVTGTPAGNDRAIDCGGNCSAKFSLGARVTLTAVPPAGKTFVSWGGACSGTSTTCVVTVNNNLSVKANFSK